MQHLNVENHELCLYGEVEIPVNHNGDFVLFSHGILSGIKESQRFRTIKAELHHQNIATAGFYFPGHGKRISEEFSLEKSAETISNGISYLVNNFSNSKISILGVSLGASIIPLLRKEIIDYIKAVVFFSLIPTPRIFCDYRFEEKHYRRWESYGYTREHAEQMFRHISEEDIREGLTEKILNGISAIQIPKLVVHGYNDSVTTLNEIVRLIDQKTTLLCYSGSDGTHDLKGLSLECASKHVANWLKKVDLGSN